MQHKPPLIPYESFAFVAEPPELPTRREGDTGSLEYVARAEVAHEHERGITLVGTTQNDEPITASITVSAPGVVRILLEGREHDPNRVTLAGDVSDAAVNLALEKADGQVTLVSNEVTVRVDLDPFHVAFYGPDGTPVLDQNYEETNVADYTTVLPFGFSTVDGERPVYHDTFTTEPDEHFYGFGEKFSGLDKRGQQLEMWNYDSYGAHTERAYKNVPFFMSSRGYAVFVDSVTHVNFLWRPPTTLPSASWSPTPRSTTT
jgi:alpha-D-xyloside xylohydrolase